MGRLLEQPTEAQMREQATTDAERVLPLSARRKRQLEATLNNAKTPSGKPTFPKRKKE